MKQLENSLLKFIQAMDEYPKEEAPVKKIDRVRYRPKSAELFVDEKIYLSPELIFFYQHCEIICKIRLDGYPLDCTDIDLGNSPLYLYSADKLVRRQEGFQWIGNEKKRKSKLESQLACSC